MLIAAPHLFIVPVMQYSPESVKGKCRNTQTIFSVRVKIGASGIVLQKLPEAQMLETLFGTFLRLTMFGHKYACLSNHVASVLLSSKAVMPMCVHTRSAWEFQLLPDLTHTGVFQILFLLSVKLICHLALPRLLMRRGMSRVFIHHLDRLFTETTGRSFYTLYVCIEFILVFLSFSFFSSVCFSIELGHILISVSYFSSRYIFLTHY